MSAEPIVLLDLDDTLLDFKKAEARALSQSLTEMDIPHDKALLEQNCNRKTWLVGYESISERCPFEQNWMYDMFFIPVRMQVAWGY